MRQSATIYPEMTWVGESPERKAKGAVQLGGLVHPYRPSREDKAGTHDCFVSRLNKHCFCLGGSTCKGNYLPMKGNMTDHKPDVRH